MYNPKYIVNGQMWQYRGPKGPAIHTFFTADGTAIGMFQGSRGVRPDLDFKVNAARKSKVDDNTARMQSIKQLGV